MALMDDRRMTSALPTPAVVDRFLEAVLAGTGIPADVYAPQAVLDATTPGWRFQVRGPEAIADQLSKWYSDPAEFEEIERHLVDGGEVVAYLVTAEDGSVPYAAHHCHMFKLSDDGRIDSDMVWCGGRWDAALLARMAAEGDAD